MCVCVYTCVCVRARGPAAHLLGPSCDLPMQKVTLNPIAQYTLSPRPPPCFAIQHTILVIEISCKGQVRDYDPHDPFCGPFLCFAISLLSYNTPQQQSAESRNSANAEALAVTRRPKEASREKTRQPPVSRGSSP